MSNIFHSDNLDADFLAFQAAVYKTNEIKNKLSEAFKPQLKRYHRLTYVMALFANKLESKWQNEGNKFLYVTEILSDLLSNISIGIIGFYQPSQILTRRLIENFYNHIFYFEHPVEYELLNMGRNEYTPMIDLKNYYETHPVVCIQKDANIKNFNSSLFSHYQDLCKTVHTKGIAFMGLAKNLEEIKPNFDISKHFEVSNQSLQNVIYLLYRFHTDVHFTHVEKDIISKSFPKNLRTALLS